MIEATKEYTDYKKCLDCQFEGELEDFIQNTNDPDVSFRLICPNCSLISDQMSDCLKQYYVFPDTFGA